MCRGSNGVKVHVKQRLRRRIYTRSVSKAVQRPSGPTYSGVVSRDSVKIALLMASLNELELSSCDIGNAYLNAPCQEKIWFVAGPECGKDRGKVCVLVRALYGLKSSGASWRAMFSCFIRDVLHCLPSRIDQDVYLRRSYREGGVPYYEYLLVRFPLDPWVRG